MTTVDPAAAAPTEGSPTGEPSIEQRVAELLGQMTLDEKIAQLGSAWAFHLMDEHGGFDREAAKARLASGMGQITRIAGATSFDTAGVKRLTGDIDAFLQADTRLGIPAIVHEECVSGYMALDGVVYPAPIGQAASWDPDLVERIADLTRIDMVAAGTRHGLAPVLDVARDPRWGRIEECFGEDPYLVAALGVAFINGLQGDDLRTGVLATAKHYLGHGVPAGGRNAGPQSIPARELRDVHLKPFVAAVHAGVATVMHAYTELDGVPTLANTELLSDVLRGELGFDGLLVSDYNAIDELTDSHGYTHDVAEATVIALTNGLDVELPTSFGYAEPLADLVGRGVIDIGVVDRSVARVLRAKLALGLLDEPGAAPPVPEPTLDEARALARDAAVGSSVLLTNTGGALPLSTGENIALIGPNAVSVRNLLGDYAHTAHVELLEVMRGHDNALNALIPQHLDLTPAMDHLRSIATEFTDRYPGEVRVVEGCSLTGDETDGFAEAVAAARWADTAVIVLGERSGLTPDCTCGEARDRTDLGLPGVQQRLLDEVVATGTQVVLVTMGGRPLALEAAAESVAAWLHVWTPGEQGGAATVDVLLGDREPEGRLTVTVPRHVGQVPIYYSQSPTGQTSRWWVDYVDRESTPLFAFGHGLGYTTWQVGPMDVAADRVAIGGRIGASVRVENTGDRPGTTVVQLYAAHEGPRSVTRPVRELIGFRRVRLDAGASAIVEFDIDTNALAFTTARRGYAVEPGAVRLSAGVSSDDLSDGAVVTLDGDVTPIPLSVPFTTSTVEPVG